MCLGIVLNLSVAALSERLVHLCVARVRTIDSHGNRVHRLLHLGTPKSIPVLTGSAEGLLSVLRHQLILVLIDLHVFLSLLPTVARVVLAVPNNYYKTSGKKE